MKSDDNKGTYVVQTFGPEFRVTQIDTDDLYYLYDEYDPDTHIWSPNVKIFYEALKESKVFVTLEDAWDVASNIEDATSTPLGASLITDFDTIKFSDVAEEYGRQTK